MTDIELKFIESRISKQYLDLLKNGQYLLALTVHKSEKMLFKHALRLSMHYFKNNAVVYDDFNCQMKVESDLYFISDKYYHHGDLKIAINTNLLVKVYLYDELSLAFTIPEDEDEGYDLEEWLIVITEEVAKRHRQFKRQV